MSGPSESSDGRHADEIAKLAKFITGVRVCMFTTMDSDGRLISRPMAVQEVEFDGDLWFFTRRDGRKITHVEREPQGTCRLTGR